MTRACQNCALLFFLFSRSLAAAAVAAAAAAPSYEICLVRRRLLLLFLLAGRLRAREDSIRKIDSRGSVSHAGSPDVGFLPAPRRQFFFFFNLLFSDTRARARNT